MPASLVMLALGAFRFGVNGANHQELKRSAEFRWTQSNRLGRAPASQYLGPGVQKISLDGTIYPHFRGGLRQVELMRLQARPGFPLMLVDGLGFVFDQWVITQVEEGKTYMMADGAPRKIEFTVALESYGRDQA